MDIDEIRAYLRENLRVSVEKRCGGFGSSINENNVLVSLELEGVEISSSQVSIVEGERQNYY